MASLNKPEEMRLIYDTCKQVFYGEINQSSACAILEGKTIASMSSLRMYFDIYRHMRKGTCYKMGTSAPFTKFLIENIYIDDGKEAMLIALSSAKQNSDYRKSCNNEQPGIETVCKEIIREYNLNIKYENLDNYKNTSTETKRAVSIGKTNIQKNMTDKKTLKVKITIGTVIFEAEGDPQTVVNQEKMFIKEIMPSAVSSLENCVNIKLSNNSSSKGMSSKSTGEVKSIGSLLKKHKKIEKLKNTIDFKAKMIPLLYLATYDNIQNCFTIKEIQNIMKETLAIEIDRKQIEGVIKRRPSWFEIVNENPLKVKLLSMGKNYAKDVLKEL